MSQSSDQLPPNYFERYDDSEDQHFYQNPRLTVHIDAAAIAAAGQLYSSLLPHDGVLLDLMSSWRSHLPPTLPYTRLVGLGMNAVELEQNPQLTEHVVQDLNRTPQLPFDNGYFDGAICTVSVQYLIKPVKVFAEVGRVLKPGAPFITTFSNRCFPSKAVQVWTATDDQQHLQLVSMYFQLAGCFHNIEALDRSPKSRRGDPLYAVVGYKT